VLARWFWLLVQTMADSSAELAWSIEEVGAWIEELGFPMYKVRAPM